MITNPIISFADFTLWNKTGVRGYYWSKKDQRYCVQIRVNYKRYHVGLFENLEEAKKARIAAEQKYWRKGV